MTHMMWIEDDHPPGKDVAAVSDSPYESRQGLSQCSIGGQGAPMAKLVEDYYGGFLKQGYPKNGWFLMV